MIALTGSLAAQVHKTQRAPKEKLAAWATLEWTYSSSEPTSLNCRTNPSSLKRGRLVLFSPTQEIHLVVFLVPEIHYEEDRPRRMLRMLSSRKVCIMIGVANAYLGGGLMRRAVLALSMVVVAATVASVSLLFVPDTSHAAAPWWAGGPSQGSFTTGKAGPNEPSLVDATAPSAAEAEDLMFAASGGGSGNAVVQEARRYIGTRYRYATCSAIRMSCTCLTKTTWAKFGHRLSMVEVAQRRYEPSRRIRYKSNLMPGDIVFFKEGGTVLTHVGIYSGGGNIVHASKFFGKVVESKMRYIRGYAGAQRLQPR
jgi:cell wall-associated NlpC family hydrolase